MAVPEYYVHRLHCFLQSNPILEKPDRQVGSDVNELIAESEKLIAGGRYKCLVLFRWNAPEDDWEEIRRWP